MLSQIERIKRHRMLALIRKGKMLNLKFLPISVLFFFACGPAIEIHIEAGPLTRLATARSRIELYQIQHQGQLPDLANRGWSQLTGKTDVNGNIISASDAFGPYLQIAPVNPFTESDSVIVPGANPEGQGWVWDHSSGSLQLIVPSERVKDLGSSYSGSDIVVY